jgi:hypothetical protein
MSKKRATVYAFGAAVIAIVAYHADASSQAITLWGAGLAAAIPFGALVLATVRTWPRKSKAESDNA